MLEEVTTCLLSNATTQKKHQAMIKIVNAPSREPLGVDAERVNQVKLH